MVTSSGARPSARPAPRRHGWACAAVAALAAAVLAILPVGAEAVDYDFASVYSAPTTLADLGATVPSVSSTGIVTFGALVFDPVANRNAHVVFRSDGAQLVSVLNLTDALGAGTPSSVVGNDAGAVAVNYTLENEAVIVRIALDGSFVVLARADQLGSTPYRAFPSTVALNTAGQVAVLATNHDATTSILRVDDTGVVEIARSSATLTDLGRPTLDDAGVVAFTARGPGATTVRAYTGSGGPLTVEGTAGGCAGPSSGTAVIDDMGLVLADCAGLPLFVARGGLVSVVVSGAEDPIFGRLASGYSHRGQPVFVTGPVAAPTEIGLFTGTDPVAHKVVRTGDVVFGLPADDVRIGHRAVNAAGQIALLLQVGGGAPVSHVVLATPRRMPQSIDFPAPPAAAFGDPPFPVTATASSGLAVTVTGAGACSVTGSTVTVLGAGLCTLTASQAGDATYWPAADVIQTVTIARAAQSIAFGPLPNATLGDPPFTLAATASSGLPVTFSTAGACAVSGNLVTLAAAGGCTIIAAQAGNADYEPAPTVAQAITVGRGSQTITFAPLADQTYGNPPLVVSATASSGLPVTFSTTGACTVTGTLVTFTGACTVVASQAGNVDYEPAPDVARAFALAPAVQTISLAPLPDRRFGDLPFAVTASASSGLPVSFAATGTCAFAGDTVTLTGRGSCSVTASQPGDGNYLAAPDVTRTFVIARATQTISFSPLSGHRLGDPPFEVVATASSALPVAFAAAGACSVTGTTVSVTAAGRCTVTASQAGSTDYEPASAVARDFAVSGVILEARFDGGADGFEYVDNPFRGTVHAGYASGAWIPSGGFRGGALRVSLGGLDGNTVFGMSGGWRTTFDLPAPTRLLLYVRANLTQSAYYETDEKSELLVSVDGVLRGAGGDHLAQLVGDGNTGGAITTGWRLFWLNLGTLAAGRHTLVIGGFNSKKTEVGESSTVLIDDVLLTETGAGAQAAVANLSLDRFKENIRVLAEFGDRTQGSPSNIAAGLWLESQLRAAGYTIERHRYTYNGQPRDNIYATKVGTLFPDQMYIVSAHFDGRGGGGAANDDASGCSLVLEAARALAGVPTAVSVRFVFWNNEETGLNGSTAYVNQRLSLQGLETPPGSGTYPEPRWLGIVQHDQILFDHGLPPQPEQIPTADIDVEYQASSTEAARSLQLAQALRGGNQTYSADYPAQIGANMNYTDSVPFRNHTAAVSVRDNQRVAEIGNGSNPHWHQPTDVYTAFSEADFLLGFNAVQMTLGTIAELAGATTP
jgi:Peptidase family M28